MFTPPIHKYIGSAGSSAQQSMPARAAGRDYSKASQPGMHMTLPSLPFMSPPQTEKKVKGGIKKQENLLHTAVLDSVQQASQQVFPSQALAEIEANEPACGQKRTFSEKNDPTSKRVASGQSTSSSIDGLFDMQKKVHQLLRSSENNAPPLSKEIFERLFPTSHADWRKISYHYSCHLPLWTESKHLFDVEFFQFLMGEALRGKKIVLAIPSTDFVNFQQQQELISQKMFSLSPLFLGNLIQLSKTASPEDKKIIDQHLASYLLPLLRCEEVPKKLRVELACFAKNHNFDICPLLMKGINAKQARKLAARLEKLLQSCSASGMGIPLHGFKWAYGNQAQLQGLHYSLDQYNFFIITEKAFLAPVASSRVALKILEANEQQKLLIVAPMYSKSGLWDILQKSKHAKWIFYSHLNDKAPLKSYIEACGAGALQKRANQLGAVLRRENKDKDEVRMQMFERLGLCVMQNYLVRQLFVGNYERRNFIWQHLQIPLDEGETKQEAALKYLLAKVPDPESCLHPTSTFTYLTMPEEWGEEFPVYIEDVRKIFEKALGKSIVALTSTSKNPHTQDAHGIIQSLRIRSLSFLPETVLVDPACKVSQIPYSMLANAREIIKLAFTGPQENELNGELLEGLFLLDSVEEIQHILNQAQKTDWEGTPEEKEYLESLMHGIPLIELPAEKETVEGILTLPEQIQPSSKVVIP